MNKSPEQLARDMLERMGIEGAQDMSADSLAELTNLINETVPRAIAPATLQASCPMPTAMSGPGVPTLTVGEVAKHLRGLPHGMPVVGFWDSHHWPAKSIGLAQDLSFCSERFIRIDVSKSD